MIPARTNADLVKKVLGDNYGPNVAGDLPDLTPFIRTASAMMDQVVAGANRKGGVYAAAYAESGIDSLQEIVERWLAGHYYAHADQLYQSRNTQGASGSFQVGQLTSGLGSTQYGMAAMDLDFSGVLKNINKQQRVGFAWLGKNAVDQIPYDQRG